LLQGSGDDLLARREAGSLRLRNKLDWVLLQQDRAYLLSEAFRVVLRLPDANPKGAL
jgi:hypothetical protein